MVMITILIVADSDVARWAFSRVVFALLLFFFTAVVAPIALAQLLCLEISMVLITRLKLLDLLLKLAEVQFEVFIDFTHL